MLKTMRDKLTRSAAGESPLAIDPLGDGEGRFALIRLEDIRADESQPRKDFGDLEGLAASIREHGVLQPIVVEPLDNRTYRIIAGERRFRASSLAGKTEIPATIRTFAQQQRLEIQLIENILRKDLNPIEEAESYRRLMDEFNLTQTALAERLGKSKASISETLKIRELPEEIMAGVRTSEQVSKSVLLEIAKEGDPAKQTAMWEQVQNGGLTVRKARGAVGEKSAMPKRATHTIKLEKAWIVIQFLAGKSNRKERIKVLEEALEMERTGKSE